MPESTPRPSPAADVTSPTGPGNYP